MNIKNLIKFVKIFILCFVIYSYVDIVLFESWS